MIIQINQLNSFTAWCTKLMYNGFVIKFIVSLAVLAILILYLDWLDLNKNEKISIFGHISKTILNIFGLALLLMFTIVTIFADTPDKDLAGNPNIQWNNKLLLHSNADFDMKDKQDIEQSKKNIGFISYKDKNIASIDWTKYNQTKIVPLNNQGKAMINIMKYTDRNYHSATTISSATPSNMKLTSKSVTVNLDNGSSITIKVNASKPNKLYITTKKVNLKPLTKIITKTVNTK